MIGFLVDLLILMMRITILKHLLSHGISLIYMLATFPERFDYRRKIDSEANFGLVSGQDASPGSSLSKTASYSKTYISVILIFTKPRRMRGGCNSRLSLLCSHTGPLSIALIVVMQRAQNYLFFSNPVTTSYAVIGSRYTAKFPLANESAKLAVEQNSRRSGRVMSVLISHLSTIIERSDTDAKFNSGHGLPGRDLLILEHESSSGTARRYMSVKSGRVGKRRKHRCGDSVLAWLRSLTSSRALTCGV